MYFPVKFFCCEALSGQYGRMANLASPQLPRQMNGGLSFSMTSQKIKGPSGAIYLPLLVLQHNGLSTHKGMSTFQGLEA